MPKMKSQWYSGSFYSSANYSCTLIMTSRVTFFSFFNILYIGSGKFWFYEERK